MSVDISVVIPFHEREIATGERPCRLARVLAALDHTDPRPAEVICVDDNSPVPCEFIVHHHRANYVRTIAPIQEPHVAHRALARELGLRAARHKVVLFLDADILVTVGLMGEILKAIQQYGLRAMVFAPRRDVIEGEPIPGDPSMGKRAQLFNLYMEYAAEGFQQPFWARQSSHCFAVTRKFVQSAGGWDANFIGWGEEDTELFYRLWRMGGSIVTLHDAVVGHLAHSVDHEANYKSFSRNARYFMEKHPDVARTRRSFYRYFGILQGE